MTTKYKLLVVFILVVSIFILDQATKFWAVETLQGQSGHFFLGGLFQLIYAENPGAFLGLGGGWSRQVRFVIFSLFVIFGLGGLLWYLIKHETLKYNLYAYTFILAGGCGNLWDRVYHENGHVVDFLLIEIYGPIRTGVFNIADIAIVIGVLIALFGEKIFNPKQPTPSP